ncbi:MAG: polyketide cyclase, partial [Nocardioidaceae bacterium]|nr:polyketide cyclase [Nocardioidaceae bacterium]
MNQRDQLPADTRTMRIVHHALRRDLTRATQVLRQPPYPHPRQRAALADHLVWMMDFLHQHHASEDAGLYPVVRRRNPAAAALLDEMDRDHDAIGPGMAGLQAAATAYRDDPGAREQVLAAVAVLEATLLPHLRREEDEMMPVVAQSITRADWDRWDDEFNVGPKSKRVLADEGLWILEDLAGEDRRVVEALVPPVPRWIILHVLSRGYRRRAFARWWSRDLSPW